MEKHFKNQILKFKLYGFFKNLRFFDPFLLLYLTYNEISVAQIGILYAIREAIIYFMEIPSGVIADNYGKKNELVICFLFYISSFVFFFIGGEFYIFVFAFILFGLGEAFRSGTHKAMIMDFMDYHNIKDQKSKIYGSTRAISMVGSTLSSLLSIVIVTIIPNLSFLFIIAIIPYIADLVLILSYPEYLNLRDESDITIKDFVNKTIYAVINVFKTGEKSIVVLDSALYQAIFKTIKDYIQLILFAILVNEMLKTESDTEIIIAVIYAGLYFLSAIASKYSHVLLTLRHRDIVLNSIWLITSGASLVFVLVSPSLTTIIIGFSLFYILLNLRKPIMVEKIGDICEINERASILSIESQIASLIIIIIAPLFGYLYEFYGYEYIFVVIAVIGLIIPFINLLKKAV